jgi:hypothetical protein
MLNKAVNFAKTASDTNFFFNKDAFHARNSRFKGQNPNA